MSFPLFTFFKHPILKTQFICYTRSTQMSLFLLAKSLHLIGMVAWFAGLFYIVRLFIYHVEAGTKPDPERHILQSQFQLMEKRLWYFITWPAFLLTLIAGLSMLSTYPMADQPWLHWKLLLVLLLIGYHFYCGHIRKQLLIHPENYSSRNLRFLNEIPTLLLVGIVFLAVTKSVAILPKVYLGLGVFFAIIMGILMLVKWNKK